VQYILRNHVDDWCINYARADDSKSCGRLTLLRRRWQKSKKLSCRSRKATNSPDVWVLLSGILMKKAALFTTVLHSGRRTPWASWPPLHGWRWTRPTWRRPARHACVVTESPLLASTITMTRRAPTEYNHRREGVRVDLSVWRSRGRAEGGQDCSVSMASGWWPWIAGAPALAGSAGEGRIGHHGVWGAGDYKIVPAWPRRTPASGSELWLWGRKTGTGGEKPASGSRFDRDGGKPCLRSMERWGVGWLEYGITIPYPG